MLTKEVSNSEAGRAMLHRADVRRGRPRAAHLQGLRGKKIGTSGLGAAETLSRELLKRHGMEAGRDVTLVNTGADAVRYQNVIGGSTDATVITLPWNCIPKPMEEKSRFIPKTPAEMHASAIQRSLAALEDALKRCETEDLRYSAPVQAAL